MDGNGVSHVGQRSGGVWKTVPQKQATVQLMTPVLSMDEGISVCVASTPRLPRT
jgi:hypothetical protein